MHKRSFSPAWPDLALILGGVAAAHGVANGLERPGHGEQCCRSRTKFPPELIGSKARSRQLFGYNQFKVIGQSRKTLVTGSEDWLAASKYFSLHVDSKGETEAGYLLKLKFFRRKAPARNGSQAE